jgi:arylsulfatase A-like enzyme
MRRLASALLLAACGASAAPAPRVDAPASAPNVVIVLVDTLRADALGAHGATRPGVSPNVDAFAAESLVFDLAISPNAWTVPAVASIFTSTWPQTHGVLRFREFERVELETLAPSFVTVAEVFRANGWETAALLKTGVITASHGFDQGFDTFERLGGDIASGWSGAQLTTAAGAWLDRRPQRERPFFLYLHYMDPHTPYQPPPPVPDWARSSESRLTGAHREVAALDLGSRVATEADRAHLRALYDAEVMAFDRAFGDLLARIEAQDDGRGTVIVLVADHGEQLGEHGGWLHSDLWPENVHVPWMIRGPGVAAGRVEGVVSTIDLAPTLAEVAGLAAGPGWQGSRGGRGRSAAIGRCSPSTPSSGRCGWTGER